MVLDVWFAVLAEWRTSVRRSSVSDCWSSSLSSCGSLPWCCSCLCCCCCSCSCSSVSWKSWGRRRRRNAERCCLRNCTLWRFQLSVCPSRTFYMHTSRLVHSLSTIPLLQSVSLETVHDYGQILSRFRTFKLMQSSHDECRTAPDCYRPLKQSDGLEPWPASRQIVNYIHRNYLLLLSPKAMRPDINKWLIDWLTESWYSFYHPTEGRRLSRPRWLVTYSDGLPAHKQSVTHPSSNRAQCRLTTLIEANALS